MLRKKFHETLQKGIKKYIEDVAPEIVNSNMSYLVEGEDKLYIYNLEVAEVGEFPIWMCNGGDTSPTNGCGKLFSQGSVANQYSFRRKYPKDCREVLRVLEKKEALDNRPIGKDRMVEELREDIGAESVRHWLNFLEHREVVEQTQRGYTFHKENMKPLVCPFCGGTDFRKYASEEEFKEGYE